MSELEEIIDENPQSIEKPKVKRVMSDAQKDALRKGREKKAELAKMNNEIIDDVVKAKMLPKITRKKKEEIMAQLKDEANKPVPPTPAPSPVQPKKPKKIKKIIEVVEESSDEEVVIERIVKKKPKKVEVPEVPKIPRLIRL